MKKILFLLVLTFALSSCYEDVQQVKEPEKVTTISIQNLPKDTVLVSIEGETLYVFDQKTNLVKYKIENTQKGSIPINDLIFIIMLVLLFFSIIEIIINNT